MTSYDLSAALRALAWKIGSAFGSGFFESGSLLLSVAHILEQSRTNFAGEASEYDFLLRRAEIAENEARASEAFIIESYTQISRKDTQQWAAEVLEKHDLSSEDELRDEIADAIASAQRSALIAVQERDSARSRVEVLERAVSVLNARLTDIIGDTVAARVSLKVVHEGETTFVRMVAHNDADGGLLVTHIPKQKWLDVSTAVNSQLLRDSAKE